MKQLGALCEKYGLKLNTRETEYLIINKNRNVQDNGLSINGIVLERVIEVEYWDRSREIKFKIEPRALFFKMRKEMMF